ncbi:hypothetical protein [Flavobacterium sp. ZB4R12]|uniref:hypothetical protein n=1 Tax=Flavobacterium sp. ZB4R12 TaxID=3398732 RepID=UPI003AAA7FCD
MFVVAQITCIKLQFAKARSCCPAPLTCDSFLSLAPLTVSQFSEWRAAFELSPLRGNNSV